jgi:peptidyl-tRNA hydrolase, PTH1 family
MIVDRWLVFGLGNPDAEYSGTRHNVGAACIAMLAQELGVTLRRHKSGALLADAFTPVGRTPVTLGRPGGYMNESGGPVQAALAFYSLGLDRLIVVHDELDLPLGTVRLKRGGGTSGHNGLKDIQRRCGGPDFLRVRLGIGRPPGRMDPARYVLRPFPARELDEVALMCSRGVDAVLDLVDSGLEWAQNRYHAG